MFLVLISQLKTIHFLEFIIQIILLYNFIQILQQKNFYYLLSYFFMIILFLGIMLIFFDFDIISIILWIVYAGVIIIFFIYSMSWFENLKDFYFSSKARFINYIVFSIFFVFILYFLSLDFSDEFLPLEFNNIGLIDYYDLLNVDVIEELEILGWGIVYYTSFLFIVVSYFLFITCCCVILIVSTAKRIRNKGVESFFYVLQKNINLRSFNSFKTQHIFMQEYENIYQNYTFTKNFKITGMFHKISSKRMNNIK